MLNWIVWNKTVWSFKLGLCWIELLEIELFDHLIVCIYKMCLHIIYMLKQDLALNN